MCAPNPHYEEQRDMEINNQKNRDIESPMDEAIREHVAESHAQNWTP